MSTDKVQKAIDSIQIEQDVLFRYFKAHKLLGLQAPKVENTYFFYRQSDSLYLISKERDNYYTWQSHWTYDSLKRINIQLIEDSIADSLLLQRLNIIYKLDSTQEIADSLSYDKIVYPHAENFKVYYLAKQEKDSTFSLGIDYYFLTT